MIMRRLLLLVAGLLALEIEGSQPSAPKPVAAPIRDLPWGQLNFLATTDTHGWLGGHLQESQYSADWGDYISFAEHMKADADKRGVDLLLVDTGDRVDGNGLYDGSNPKGLYTNDILKQQHIDIICSGNHELYKAATSEREYNETIPNFPEQYIASNIDILHPETGQRIPLSRRYRQFTTKNQGIKVLAFGFLFDFTGNANNTFVQRVEDTVKEDWFQDALREKVDIFVVIGHVPPHSDEYKAVFTAIRSQNWDTPIQFFSGHSHIRDFAKLDSKAYALQSGRYMETVGWMSIDGIQISGDDASVSTTGAAAKMKFERRYIDNNLFGYHHHTGLNSSTFPTALGQNVSLAIHAARKEMGLDQVYGCSPQDYWVNRVEYPNEASVFSLLTDEILPGILVPEDRSSKPRIAIINTGGIRFDIFKGTFTRDTTYLIAPFDNAFRVIPDVPWDVAKKVLPLINAGGTVFDIAGVAEWEMAPPQQISIQRDIVVSSTDSSHQRHDSAQSPMGVNDDKPALIPGYTTSDDGGSDGDDTEHAPLSFYRVPNCVEARIAFPNTTADDGDDDEVGEPETVDLVFIDFVQPWVLLALRFAGKEYAEGEVEEYMGGKGFTEMLLEWVGKNWGGEC